MLKNTLSTLALCFITLSASAQDKKPSLKALDEKYGFREARFEVDTTAFTDLVRVEKDGNNTFYHRTGDNKKIGEADLKEITYGFYKGKLSDITITTSGYTNSRAVLAAFRAQYGPGTQTNRYIEKYYWWGKQARMMYSENSATHDASITIFSTPLYELQKKDDQTASKKAASDL